MIRSLEPPPEARRSDSQVDQASALTAAVCWFLKYNGVDGLRVSQIHIVLSLDPLASRTPAGWNFNPHTSF